MHPHLLIYGITPQILRKAGVDLNSLELEGSAADWEIREAVEVLVPKRSGHDLIRLGGNLDGGYLLPNDFAGIEACFSPGTNKFKRFEDDLCNIFSIKSFMCDAASDLFLFQTPMIDGMQFFEKKWLDIDRFSDQIDINDWVAENTDASSDLILQMDIEGAEYRNLMNINAVTLQRF